MALNKFVFDVIIFCVCITKVVNQNVTTNDNLSSTSSNSLSVIGAGVSSSDSGITGSFGDITTESTAGIVDVQHNQQIQCIIFNQLSSDACKNSVLNQLSGTENIETGCAKVEPFKPFTVKLDCSTEDYTKLFGVICNWDGKESCTDYYQIQLNKITEVENQLSPSCSKPVLNNIKNENLSDYCKNLTKARDNLVSQNLCEIFEVYDLKNAVCCNGIACTSNIIDVTTREGRIMNKLKEITSRCANTIVKVRNALAQSPEKACANLEATKSSILGGLVCTASDYSLLQEVVCHPDSDFCPDGSLSTGDCTVTLDPFPEETQQKHIIQATIFNVLKGQCQNLMMGQAAQQATDPLEKTCRTLLDNRGFIVVGGQCTEEEYEIMKSVVCVNLRGNGAEMLITNVAIMVTSALFVIIKIIS